MSSADFVEGIGTNIGIDLDIGSGSQMVSTLYK